ncbi:hypothetical protein BV20DRAFT_1054737 [Pilatotrama ljubarskyi]|nr:hypothetical protein BV20DRAFT_1054737 [Pilatotrama ljubarskyi]
MAANHPYLFDGAKVRPENSEETLKGLVMSSGKMVLLDKLLQGMLLSGEEFLEQFTKISAVKNDIN